ncbi:hypothetical protein ACXJJ3_37850 [Kribbella sp. WER1]
MPDFAPPQHFQQSFGPPVRPPRRRRTGLIVTLVAGLCLLLVAGATTYYFTRPDKPQAAPLPDGTLPQAPTIKTPPAVAAVASLAGLTCYDEVTEPWQLKGCYKYEDGRIVQARFKITAGGTIDKFQLQVMDDKATPSARVNELLKLAAPVFDAVKLSAADRSLITTSLQTGKNIERGKAQWGKLNLAQSPTTATLGLEAPTVQYLPYWPVAEDYRPVVDELRTRGYDCKVDPGSHFECKKDDLSMDGGIVDNGISTMSVWWSGSAPAYDAPVMVDAYAVLARAGSRGEALRQGLARINKDHSELLYVDGVRLLRWTGHIELTGVSFA